MPKIASKRSLATKACREGGRGAPGCIGNKIEQRLLCNVTVNVEKVVAAVGRAASYVAGGLAA